MTLHADLCEHHRCPGCGRDNHESLSRIADSLEKIADAADLLIQSGILTEQRIEPVHIPEPGKEDDSDAPEGKQ